MASVAIRKKPTGAPGSLTAPTRKSGGSTTHEVTWKNNSANFKDNNDHRIQGHEWWWVITQARANGDTRKWTTKTYKSSNTSLSSLTLSLGGITLSNGKHVSYEHLFPRVKDGVPQVWWITGISINIRAYNSKGKGPLKTATRKYYTARTPEVGELSQDEETGHVSCTVKSDDGNDYHDRLNTKVTIDVLDTRKPEGQRTTSTVKTVSSTSYTAEYDVEDRFNLSYDDYVCVRVSAQAQGYSGPSGVASRNLYVSWPNKPVILTKQVVCPTRTQGGKVTIPIDLMRTDEHPATGVRLQVLANVAYERASDIPATEEDNWRDVGVPDDGDCTALSVDMSLVIPDTEGMRSWVRIKSWNQLEDGFYRYSDYYQLENLYTSAPTAEVSQCAITSCVSANDGLGAMVTVGYRNDGNTGTEIAWSDREDAWTSTDQPDTFQVTWDDDAQPTVDWDKFCTVDIRGLDEGTSYYVRARRYLDRDDADTTYSPWSAIKTVTPSVAPGVVTLSAPASVPIGSDCALTWAFDGGTQIAWQVTSGGRVLKSGEDALGSTTIDGEALQSAADGSGMVPVSVTVQTGGGTATSAESYVVIARPPTLSIVAGIAPGGVFSAGDVTAQPLAIKATSSSPTSVVAITVRAQGVDSGALGQLRQVAGDVIWSSVVTPAWSAIGGTASKNLISNKSSVWTSGYYVEHTEHINVEGQIVVSSEYVLTSPDVRLRTISPIALESGSTYTLSATGVPQPESEEPETVDGRWRVSAIPADSTGTVIGDAVAFGSSVTVTPTGSVAGYYLVVEHSIRADGETEYVPVSVSPIEIGSSVLVQLESGSTATEWEQPDADADAYEATIIAPDELDLRDNAYYEVTATATDQTQLTSQVAECAFRVMWTHQAPKEYDNITIAATDTTDEDGIRTRQCVITLAAPTDTYNASDLYDVWRMTPDGYYLIAEGVEIGGTVTDPYAPYGTGEYGYRIACRTVDGDIDWDDFTYTLPGKDLRIDFGEDYIELPYNVSISDGYTKDFESRRKLDGSIDGYWNDGTERKGTYSSDIIRIWEPDKIATLRRLGDYAGPCFVRTPDGCAYEANVQINSMGGSRRSNALAVSIDADEVALTQYVAEINTPEEYDPEEP